MKELDTYPLIVNGANKKNWLLYRIQDGNYGNKPCDIIGINQDGIGVIIEVKLLKAPSTMHTKMPYNLLEFHQRIWLDQYTQRGGIAYFVLAHDKGATFFRLENGWEEKPKCELWHFQITWDKRNNTSIGWP